jgi:hypothetical protein
LHGLGDRVVERCCPGDGSSVVVDVWDVVHDI